MEALQQQLANMQLQLCEKEDQIARLNLEAQGAAQAAQSANAEAAKQAQIAQQRAEQLARLENTRYSPGSSSPAENVLKKLQTPHILRDLPCFDGNPIKLHQFLRAIDNIMPVIDEARGSPMYSVWIQCIRSKVVGDADTVLELYGTELSWEKIKYNLITHYNDKRDEVSLTRDLFKQIQTTTVEEFYGKVSHIIALLVNQLGLTELNHEVKEAKKSFYQQIGLKVFLAGLKEPLGPIIRAQAPETMKEALRLCMEENNYSYAKHPFKANHTPPIPPKPIPTHQPFLSFKPPPTFRPYPQFKFPQLAPNPQPKFPPTNYKPFPNNPNQFNQFQPRPFQPRPFQPKPFPQTQNVFAPRPTPQPKPIPMDVDPSIRSRRLNYMNRPHFHENEWPAYYYEFDNNQFYYPEWEHNEFYYQNAFEQARDEQLAEQQNEYETANAGEIPEPPAISNDETPKQIEQQNVDDLNFLVADARTGMT